MFWSRLSFHKEQTPTQVSFRKVTLRMRRSHRQARPQGRELDWKATTWCFILSNSQGPSPHLFPALSLCHFSFTLVIGIPLTVSPRVAAGSVLYHRLSGPALTHVLTAASVSVNANY